MNTKRQTIWLVSMLGLMVVLSAYYLFTDDVSKMDVATEQEEMQDAAIDAVEVGEHSDLPDLGELTAAEDQTEATVEAPEAANDTEETAQASEDKNDAILKKVQAGAQTGEELLASLDMKRTDALQKETEKLMEIALDPKKSAAEIEKAEDRLRAIEETQAKVSDLEDQLMREFENVVITESQGKWSVVVQTDKLERSQVVTIIDMMMENLNVSPGRIAVEYVS